MRRLIYLFLAIGFAIGFCATAKAQSCYSQSYGQAEQYPAEPFRLAAVVPGQTQTYTVQVPVQVTVSTQAVAAPAPVAAPVRSCDAVSYAAPQAVAVPVAVPYAVPVHYGVATSYCGNVGFRASYGHVGSFRQNFGSAGFFGGASQFGAVGGLSNIVARDRRGTAVSANFQNNVRIRRGLLGNIRSVEADGSRGLFGVGRFSPF